MSLQLAVGRGYLLSTRLVSRAHFPGITSSSEI